MQIPVLTYHSAFINGNEYENNNLVALAADLRLVDRLGFRIVPLHEVARALIWRESLQERTIAFSLDDGTDFDYRDLAHPKFGVQRSAFNILHDFISERGARGQPGLHLTSFVIVSPKARRELDERCLIGAGWYNDDWWLPAASSTLMGIANHTWDHNHPDTSTHVQGVPRGTFRSIDNKRLADHQIELAQERLKSKVPNPGAALFAYPYGEYNDYLVHEYLPTHGEAMGIIAAFSTDPAPVTESTSRWNMPRFVCGANWKNQTDLELLLRDCQ